MAKAPELHEAAIEAFFKDPEGPVGRIIEHKALNVEGVMKSLLLIPGSGRTYTQFVFTRLKGVPRGTPGRLGFYGHRPPHTASAPFMSPASDTGMLLASITHELLVEETVIARVYAHAKYALFLELGTKYLLP
ncbi:MAG: hypothetical protein KGR26_13645, partial [Cyanobacteria bacterium REEB65]|nr:hypothetical protein [Cyanobacteria bacterium REEB65]